MNSLVRLGRQICQPDSPCYAITGSNQRWFWVAWPYLSALHEYREPLAHGYATTKELAIQSAASSLGSDVNDCRCCRSYVAVDWRKVFTQRDRKPKPGTAAAPIEYVYLIEWCEFDTPSWRSVAPHRVIKRTAKFIYVARERQRSGLSDTHTVGGEKIISTYRLDRYALERGEGVQHPRSVWAGKFYLDPNAEAGREQNRPYHLLPHLEALELSWPCSLDARKKVYRLKSRNAHPDSGGSQEQFIAVNEAYEYLKESLEFAVGGVE